MNDAGGGHGALPDLSHLHILLADDNATNQLVAAQMLEMMGGTVAVASDGAETLQRFSEERFDVLLLDIEMPKMSGLDVLRQIRGMEDGRADVPVIALTAYVMDEHRRRFLELGASGIIAKPLTSVEEFGREVLTILEDAALGPPGERGPITGNGTLKLDPDVFDALSEAMGPEGIGELKRRVIGDVKDIAEGLESGLASKDDGLIRQKTHILVSVSGIVGAQSLQHLAEQLNAAVHDGQRGRVAELIGQTLAEVGELIEFVESHGREG
ncbi:MAG: response regulator [Pseudomonadota bacterium]